MIYDVANGDSVKAGWRETIAMLRIFIAFLAKHDKVIRVQAWLKLAGRGYRAALMHQHRQAKRYVSALQPKSQGIQHGGIVCIVVSSLVSRGSLVTKQASRVVLLAASEVNDSLNSLC